jgi:hypothetical protein
MVDVVVALAGSDCEQLRSGWLAQPANAISSFAYVAAGLWLMSRSGRTGFDRRLLLAGGSAMVGVGLASFGYHGPQPVGAAVVHNGTVAWLAVVLIARNIQLLARARPVAWAAWRPAAAWMVPALVAYTAGRAGSPLCHPATIWQLHAVWHVLSAVGLGLAASGCAVRFRVGHPGRAGEPAVRPLS